MEAQAKRSYIQIIKIIFKNINNPDHVRLNCKECIIVSLLMSVIFSLPVSIILGIIWLIAPKEDSIFLFMLIPWTFIIPLSFICAYVYHYWKPRRNDKVINRLFTLVKMDAPITPVSGCIYVFIKNKFLFKPYFQIEPVYRKSGSKKGNVEYIIMNMVFDCDCSSLNDYHNLTENIHAYTNGKQIGNHIKICCNALAIRLRLRGMTPEWMNKIVNEFIYITERFRLRPITWEQYAERIMKLDLLLSERNK